jgi:hypothetical protein
LKGPNARNVSAEEVVRTLKALIRQSGIPDPASLIGGRWSNQTSYNFILTFDGQPDHRAVIKLREPIRRFFGNSCIIAPQKGYSRLTLRFVPIIRSNGTPSSSEELKSEILTNMHMQQLQYLDAPRWVNPRVEKPDAMHGSVTFAILDEGDKVFKDLTRNPPYMFGGKTTVRKFISKPLIRQCDRCWRLGHDVLRCPRPSSLLMCPICGAGHRRDEHHGKCKTAVKHDGVRCSCPPKCINCTRERKGKQAEGHIATDLTCPLRAKFRTDQLRTGDSTDEEEPIRETINLVSDDST